MNAKGHCRRKRGYIYTEAHIRLTAVQVILTWPCEKLVIADTLALTGEEIGYVQSAARISTSAHTRIAPSASRASSDHDPGEFRVPYLRFANIRDFWFICSCRRVGRCSARTWALAPRHRDNQPCHHLPRGRRLAWPEPRHCRGGGRPDAARVVRFDFHLSSLLVARALLPRSGNHVQANSAETV